MYKMNRVFTGFLLVALMFSGCDNQNNISHEKKTECDKLKLVPLIDELKLAPVVNDGGWKVIASSHEDDFISAMAVDGNLSTRWSSKFKDNQWWMVDFGSLQRVGKVTLNWETAYPKSYRILVSKDTDAWEEVYSTESSQGGTETIRFSPCNARYVKIECLKRATKWGNSLFEVEFNAPDPIKVDAKASSGTDAYDPRCAVDGNFKTRWSSNFTDDEWWIGEFEKPVELGGMKILWETAFGEKYNIQVSMDGENWNKVYEVTDGDGKTDIIFFKPVKSKFIKIDGIQRGTGWGYSIFEIDFFLKGKMPLVSASSSEGLLTPDLIFDGDRETFWHSGKDGKESVMIKLPGSFFLGGMELTWDTDYACSYSIDLSNDGKDWKTVFKQDEGNGKKDWVFFNSENASFVRINCKSSNSGNGYALSEIEFKSGEERATPVKSYQALAKDLPEGMFPMWLRRKQEFWTVTGLIDEVRDSIIGETGTFEPKARSFSVMPFIVEEGRVTTWADVKLKQELEEKMLPMPSVEWQTEKWNLNISILAQGSIGNCFTVLRYRFSNKTQEDFKGKLALAIRPVQLNPAWQHGGYSPLNSVNCLPGTSQIKINGKISVISLTKADEMGAVPLKQGDIISYISKGKMPFSMSAVETEGKVSTGLIYNLNVAPGQYKDVIIVFPLYGDAIPYRQWLNVSDKENYFEKRWQESKEEWSNFLNRFSIKIPEQRLINIMKTNIAYILINKDGSFIKPGPRNYDHSWMRDGSMTSVALLRAGLIDQVRKYINAVTVHITGSGWVPWIFFGGENPIGFNTDGTGEGQEYDSQGQYVFLVRQYFDYTRDMGYLKRVYPAAIRALKFARGLRKQRMTDEYRNDAEKQPYYGILPQSNSHEGYFPAVHSYWDDFWYLKGLNDGIYLAGLLNREEDVYWISKEEESFRKDLYNSIKMVMKRNGLKNIPGCVEKADFDATSTAIAIMACGEMEHLPPEAMKYTFEKYFEDFSKGMIPGQERTFTPYEVRSADAFIRMGDRQKALAMLRYFTEDSVRPYNWNHFAEVVHARERAPSYIGDMPHTWVGSGYISAVRSIFAYEDNGYLVIGAGLDPKWFEKGVEVKNLPTMYGKLNYSVKKEAHKTVFNIEGDIKTPKGFIIVLPETMLNMKVTVNGEEKKIEDKNVRFNQVPAKVVVE